MLNIENLSVVFSTDGGEVQAVKNLNLSLGASQTMGLVGESGSGKSVTALAIMRLLDEKLARITSGHIWFDHPVKGVVDLLQLNDREMQSVRGNVISMVFQEPMSSLNPVKRCGWQVMEVILQHRNVSGKFADKQAARDRVLSLFEEVKLPFPVKVFNAWPHELSGGQRQRVMIAMAMACRPRLLIADEPTTALDVTVQKGILELMQQLQNDHKMAILFISHDLGVIGSVASHASVMLHGGVVESGPVSDILNHAKHPYTRALLACRPPLAVRPEKLAVVADFYRAASQQASDGLSPSNKQPFAGWDEPSHSLDGQNLMGKLVSPSERKSAHKRIYSQQPLLAVRDLQTTFVSSRNLFGKVTARHQAVHNISFDVYPGETLGLVGESGCGKTTLGRSILQLIKADSGQVLYKGRDLRRMNSRELRSLRPRFQIIFQDPYASLTPGMMVGKAILEPMRVHGILTNDQQRKEHVMELLKRVDMEEKHFYRYPHEFSGGQRQRICIARALALDPEFIICDEAVSALDVSVQAQVLNLLNELKQLFDLTFIFISHDLSVVKYMSDRVIVMYNGKMVEIAEADALYENPSDDYTRKLFDALPAATYPPSSHP